MYKCQDCGAVFNPYEVFLNRYSQNESTKKRCPSCRGLSVEYYLGKLCGCCGAPFMSEGDFCSENCRRLAYILRRREERRLRLVRNFEVSRSVREVEDYNKKHGTGYSYGQYYSLKDGGYLNDQR